MGVSSKAPVSGNATAETVPDQALDGRNDKDTTVMTRMTSAEAAVKNTITTKQSLQDKFIASSNQPQRPQDQSLKKTGGEPYLVSKKTLNIAVVNKSQLLDMLQNSINSMAAFVKNTRNVHRELKESVANSERVLTRYLKVRKTASKFSQPIKAHKYHTKPFKTQWKFRTKCKT